MTDEAENTLEGSDTYKIETRDGKITTPQMITISKKTSIETWGKSVFLNEALIKLEEFKNDILGSGSS